MKGRLIRIIKKTSASDYDVCQFAAAMIRIITNYITQFINLSLHL